MIGKYNTLEKKQLLLFNISSFLCLFFLFLIRNSNYIKPITLSFLMLLLFAGVLLFGYRKDRNNSIKLRVFLEFSVVLLIYLIIVYSLGMKVSFIKHIYNRELIENIIYTILSVIIIEVLRYTIHSKNINDKKEHFLNTIFFILLEILVTNNYCFLNNFLVTIVIIIEKNILLGMNCKNGFKSNLLYTSLLELLPCILTYPDLSNYLYAILITITNTFLIIIVLRPNRRKEMETANKYKKGFLVVLEGSLILVVIVTISLVSGLLKYSLSSIASNSMYPSLKKGDAIIIEKLNDTEKEEIEVGDIIVFQEDGNIITHRVVEVRQGVYITKGDNNNTKDTNKKTKNDIIGLVKLRIPLLGYPSVFVSELLK